ncbi:hypothetical protein AYI82_15655 [Shewanella algae]|nr:hypothetical protein BEH76_10385 [Shewanella algae]TVL06320.1 hypothetical protein AYI82_15655 [Shewanella algae]TVL18773.1 hypothetical protein AYJ02_00840 [Shewanella algae]
MNSNDIINPASVSYRFYRVSAMTTAAILNCLPIDNRLKLTTDFSHVFKGPDGTLEPLTALCKARAVDLQRQRRQGAANCRKLFS